MSVLVDTMGFFIHVFMCVRLSVCLLYVCRLDDGPQVKKLSMEDPQAVAQAAIAKFVDKYVCVLYVCATWHVCATCGREPVYTCVFVFFFLVRVGAQLGLPHMMTVEIKIPNRMVGLGKVYVCVYVRGCVSACVRKA